MNYPIPIPPRVHSEDYSWSKIPRFLLTARKIASKGTGCLVAVSLAIFLPATGSSAGDNWTGTGTGLWSTAGNWSAGVPTISSDVTFNNAPGLNTAITLAAVAAANSLSFSATGGANAYTFDTAGTLNTHTLTISAGIVNLDAASQTFYNTTTLAGSHLWTASSGALNFNGKVNLGSGTNSYALTVNGAQTVSIAGNVADGGSTAGSLSYSGSSTLTLSGNNTYTGTTNITSGAVNLRSSGALGTAANTANTTVANGASLQMTNSIATTNGGTLVLNGNGTGLGSGALQSISGNNTWNSNIAIASAATIFSATAGNTLTLGNSTYTNLFSLGANTVTFDGAGDTWLNSNVGVAGDTGGVVKNGTGKLTFYGYNTYYTGATNVNAGSLDLIVGPFSPGLYGINGALTIGTGPANSALAGTVKVNIANNSYANQLSPTSAVTINSDGALNAGASTSLGALTLNGGQVVIASGIAISPTSTITSNANSAHQTSLITGGQTILNGATTFNVARDSTLTSDLTVRSTLSGGSIVKQGAGVLTLTSANTVSGAAINAGVVNAQSTNALGTTGNVAVARGAALQVQGGVSLGQASTTLSGTGIGNTGALRSVSGNNSLSGAITLSSASRINSDAGTLTLLGGVIGSNYDLTVGGAGNTTLAGASTFGSATLTKVDAGTLTFNSSLDLSGGTFLLNAGTLALNGNTLKVGVLHITGNSILDFGNAVTSTLNASNFIIDSGVTLTINNWVDVVDFFGAQNWSGAVPNTSGSTPMNQVTFAGFSNNSTKWQSFDKQITPVPEPATYGAWLMGTAILFFAGYREVSAHRLARFRKYFSKEDVTSS